MANSVAKQEDRCSPIVEERFGGADQVSRTVTEALTRALATVTDVEVTELEPLYETVDLDALSQLFDGSAGSNDSAATFSFPYQQWIVVIRGDGRIQVCEAAKIAENDVVQEAITA